MQQKEKSKLFRRNRETIKMLDKSSFHEEQWGSRLSDLVATELFSEQKKKNGAFSYSLTELLLCEPNSIIWFVSYWFVSYIIWLLLSPPHTPAWPKQQQKTLLCCGF